MNAATEAVISFVGIDKGLLKVLDASAKSVSRLNSATNVGIDNFAKYEDSASLAEKAIAALGDSAVATTKSVGSFSRTATGGYRDVTNAATKTISVADALDNRFVGLAARAIGVNKQFRAVNDVLQPTAGFFSEVGDEATFAGKAFTLLDASEKPVVKGLNLGSVATRDLAKNLSNLGIVGEGTANALLKVSDSLGIASRTVGITDTIGDIFQLTESLGEFAKGVPDQISDLMGLKDSFEESGAAALIMSKQMVVATHAATFLATRTTGLTSDLSKLFLAGIQIQQVANYIKIFGGAITSAYLQSKDLNTTFGVFQSLGIETTFAELAVEIGTVGEQLLFNTEVAKKFTTTTVAAFAQLQDSLAFVTTLSPGAAIGIPKMGKALQDLVNGPLENMITSQEASQALYTTMSAGMTDIGEATNFMGTALKLAAATGTDANTTIEALVKTGLSYKTAYRDVGKLAGELNQVVEEGIVTFPQLAGGLAEVAGVAAQIGVARQELLGLTSALTYTKGGAGALEGISSLLNSIAGQGEQSQKAIAELGIRFDVQSIKAKGLKKSLDELYKATGGDTTKLKTILPDSLAFETAIAIMTSASQRADETIKKVAGAGEENLEKLFGARQQSLIKEASALMNGFQEQMIAFGEKLLPVLEPGLEFLRSLLEQFQNLPEPVKDLIGGMVLFNLTVGKAVGIGQTFIGLLFGLAKAYLMSRLASLAFTGGVRGVVTEFQKIVQLISAKDFSGALSRLFDVEGLKSRAEAGQTAIAKTNRALSESRFLSDSAAIKNAKAAATSAAANRQETQSILEKTKARIADEQAAIRSATAGIRLARQALATATAETNAARVAASDAIKRQVEASVNFNSADSDFDSAKAALELAESETQATQATLQRKVAEQAQTEATLKTAVADRVRTKESLTAAVADRANAEASLQAAAAKEAQANANVQATVAERTKTQSALQSVIAEQSQVTTALSVAAANTANAEATLRAATLKRVYLQEIVKTTVGNSAAALTEFENAIATERGAAAALKAAAAKQAEAQATLQLATANTAAAQTGLAANASAGTGIIGFFGKMGQTLKGAGGLIAGVFNLLAQGAKVLWAAIGPIGVTLAVVAAGFMALQDFVPVLGGAAGKSQELAQGLERLALTGEKAKEKVKELDKNTREYTGFINNTVLPTLNLLGKVMTFLPDNLLGKTFKFNLGESVDKEFTKIKDIVEDGRSLEFWESFDLAATTTDERLTETRKKIEALKIGDFVSGEAEKIRKAASGRSLTAEEMKKVMEAEQKAIDNTKKANDNYVTGLQELLNTTETLKEKQFIQHLIDSINSGTSAMEKGATAAQKYKDNLNSIEKAIEFNNAAKSAENVLSELKKVRSQVEAEFKDMPASAKTASKEIFDVIEQNLNLTSGMNRRKAVGLVNAARDFVDNIKGATNLNSPEELNKMRQDVDNFLVKIDEAVKQNVISSDAGLILKQQIESQEIETPELKGSILSPEQIQANTESAIEEIQRQGKRVIDAQQLTVEKYKTLEATRMLSSSEANKLIAQEEANISQNRLKIQQNVAETIKKRDGETSQSYKDQLLAVQTLEQEVAVKREQARRASSEAEISRIKDYYERNQAIIEMAVLQGNMSEREGFEIRNKIRDSELKARSQILEKEIALVKSRNGNAVQLETELAQLRVDIQKNAIEKITADYERQKKQITNTSTAAVQAFNSELNSISALTGALTLQQKLMTTRNTLAQTAASFTEGELANVAKSTSSARLRAVLEARSSEVRLKNLAQQQIFDRESLELQEQMNALAVERDVIQSKIAIAENERAIALANIDLISARRLNKSEEEVRSLELQVSSLQQSGDLLKEQALTLNETKSRQDEIVKSSRTELELKQALARDGGVLDAQIAKQNELTAEFDKQKEILERQKNLFTARSGFIDSELELLQKVEKNESRRNELAKLIAINKLNGLRQQQKLEDKILESNISQEAALLRQEKARNRMMKAENLGKIAEAKTALTDAVDSGASPEQVEARLEQLEAYLEMGAALEGQRLDIEERERTQDEIAEGRRFQQDLEQRAQENQAIAQVAETLPEGQRKKAEAILRDRYLREGMGFPIGPYGQGVSEAYQGIRAYNDQNVNQLFGDRVTGTGVYLPESQYRASQVRSGLFSVAPPPPVTTPTDIDYEAIRKDYLSQLQEFLPLLPTRKILPLQEPLISSDRAIPRMVRTTPLNIDYETLKKNLENQLEKFLPFLQTPKTPTLPTPKAGSVQQVFGTKINATQATQEKPIQLTGDLNVENTVHVHLSSPEDKTLGQQLENSILNSTDQIWRLVKQRLGG